VDHKIDYEEHAKNFDEESFWGKLTDVAKAAGRELVEKALWLFYASQSPSLPAWAKTTIYGALAYLVLPIDMIPDFLPAVGFTDDAGVLAGALAMVAMHIDRDVKAKASEKLKTWFGETDQDWISSAARGSIRALAST
jgi:uncharacterized membrane protein YkvA (DUF1232 family)